MPDQPTPPTPEQPGSDKPQRAKPGFISKDLLDAIDLAEQCQREAAKDDTAPALAERDWTPADQTTFTGHIQAAHKLEQDIHQARAGKGSQSDEETAAKKELQHALDPILKGARFTFPDDEAQRTAFGKGIANASGADLHRYATYASQQLTGTPPKIKLRGVIAAEIQAVADLAAKYKDADWAHTQAKGDASELLAKLRALVEGDLQTERRNLQHAADLAWTHRDPVNAVQRKAFGLQPDRPLV
ncbi:MAG: hypothetical protein ACKVY0_26320 [Prosthecobacter sp.]|uniref:hypothetical protein n=1 Tax=Prosthecobacter sp. TaxID=1965333 RepID=UPI003901E10C